VNRPNLLAAAIAMTVTAALADEPPKDGPFGQWAVIEIAGKAVSHGATITMDIDAAGAVTGSGGCNRYRGSAKVAAGGALAFGPAAATRMMCEPGISDQEAGFFKALDEVRSWRKENVGLALHDQSGKTVLKLAPAS